MKTLFADINSGVVMNEYQKIADELYNAKLEKYRLNPDMLTDELHNQLYGEAVKEALAQYACLKG